MKIKLDENLPPGLARELETLGHDVDTVADEGLQGADDGVLWEATQHAQRFLVTRDKGFSDARKFPAGGHFGLLLLRFGDMRTGEIVIRVKEIFRADSVETWLRCCVIATEWKVRVTRPRIEEAPSR
jgi:predicted nuclease of predicted toxin-antitoxin system